MTRFFKRSCLVLLGALLLAGQAAHAELVIHITKGIEGAQPIAIVPFGWQGPAAGPPTDVARVISDDLARSGLFAPIARKDLPSRPTDPSSINFSDWRLLRTANLVIGDVAAKTDGHYSVKFRLFDVFRGTQMVGYPFDVPPGELRMTAHRIADIIYQQLTGTRGAFATRIAYVLVTGPPNAHTYRLMVADSDGYNPQWILRSKEPILSPAWSPDGRKLAYTAFVNGESRVFVHDLKAGTRQLIAAYPGINSSPAWSPDGKTLALTLSKDGNAEIYLYHLQTKQLVRLTFSGAIDTEATFSPDGKTIAFTSDRGGHPQIYTMPVTGGHPKRLTFDGDYNARAEYSPDGKKMAIVHRTKDGRFTIGLLDLENGALQVLTDGPLDESPSFAPNGSMILYATAGASGAGLAEVSVDGRVRNSLAEQGGEVTNPSWSPFGTPP